MACRLLALVTLFALATPTLTYAETPITVRVATIGIMDDAGLYVAMERGYLLDKGIKVELVSIAGAGDVMAMLATSQLEFVAGGYALSVFNAIARGLPVRAILPRAVSIPGHDGNSIMVRPDLVELIKSPRDLKGRKFAITSPVAAGIYALGKAMEREGLSIKDLDLVAIPFPAMSTAFSTKAIDIALQVEPFVTLSREQGIAMPWKSVSDFVYDPFRDVGAYFVNSEWAERNAKLVQDFVMQYLRGVRVYHEALTTGLNRDEIITLFVKYTRVKERALYERTIWPFNDPNGHIITRSVEDQIDWYFRNGRVSRKVSVDQVVDTRYVERALKELGAVRCSKCVR